MLNIDQLEEMENHIRSGQLEKEFRESGETQRYYILELLEKLMDVAELADEAATRLIFRGIPQPVAQKREEKTEADKGA